MKRALQDNDGDGMNFDDLPIAMCNWDETSGTQQCTIIYIEPLALSNSTWMDSWCTFENDRNLAYIGKESTMNCMVSWLDISYTASCSVAKLASGALPYEACTCLTASERYLDTDCWNELDCDWKQETYQQEIEECTACEKMREGCSCSFLEPTNNTIDYNGIPWSDSMLVSISAARNGDTQYNLEDIYPHQPSIIYQDFPHDMQIGCPSTAIERFSSWYIGTTMAVFLVGYLTRK